MLRKSMETPGQPRRFESIETKRYHAISIIGGTTNFIEMKILWKRSRLGFCVREITAQLANNQVAIPVEISSTPQFENTRICVVDTKSEDFVWLESFLMERIPGTPGKSGEKEIYIRILQLVADYTTDHYLHTIQMD